MLIYISYAYDTNMDEYATLVSDYTEVIHHVTI
jgi:hypothetical protein